MKKKIIAFVMVLLALVGLFLLHQRLTSASDPTWDRVQRSGILRVGLDPSFPPFEADDGKGTISGMDVDLARSLAERIGVSAKIEAIGFDSLLDALWAKRVDAVISAMPMDYTKSKDVTYSIPYFDAGQYLVLRRDHAHIHSLSDLDGHSLAVEWGSEGDALARQLKNRMPGIKLVLKEDPNSALKALASGEADAALVDGVSARMFDGKICILSPPISSTPYAVVMPAKAPKLSKAVDQALEEMKKSGELQSLVRKWIYPPGANPEEGCPTLSLK